MEFTAAIPSGMRANWYSTGATLAELHVPDRDGRLVDVVLGFDEEERYHTKDNQHFGSTTGRFANRIAGGKFTLDGREYLLALNNGPNHLHGGSTRDLSRVDWRGEPFEGELGLGVRFYYTSPDGEENYPGSLNVVVTYTLTLAGALRIDYAATTDKATIINLTNHAYFNLSGHGTPSALDHVVWIGADKYTPKDDVDIPTGEIAPVAGTPLDFRTPTALGERIAKMGQRPQDGYDHNYVLNGPPEAMRLAATVFDPASGRTMRVHTDQPGVQLYVGNMLRGQTGKGGKTYPRRSALCLETQHFPDSPNKPQFPSTVLRPGQTYRHTCVYEFAAE